MLMWKYYGIALSLRMEAEGNRPDPVVTDRREKVINVVKMGCPSLRNRSERKKERKEDSHVDYVKLRCFCIFVFVHPPVPHKR